jgi:hypothetical protein
LFDEIVTDLGHDNSTTTVKVFHGTTPKQDYSVPVNSPERRALAKSEERQALH